MAPSCSAHPQGQQPAVIVGVRCMRPELAQCSLPVGPTLPHSSRMRSSAPVHICLQRLRGVAAWLQREAALVEGADGGLAASYPEPPPSPSPPAAWARLHVVDSDGEPVVADHRARPPAPAQGNRRPAPRGCPMHSLVTHVPKSRITHDPPRTATRTRTRTPSGDGETSTVRGSTLWSQHAAPAPPAHWPLHPELRAVPRAPSQAGNEPGAPSQAGISSDYHSSWDELGAQRGRRVQYNGMVLRVQCWGYSGPV